MLIKNKHADMTPYPMSERPCRQSLLVVWIVWIVAWVATKLGRLRIAKIGMKGLKPPYLVFSWHQGFPDYYIVQRMLQPRRANYVSDVEGFAHFGKWIYSKIGCVATRRYVTDVSLIRNLKHITDHNGDIAVVFPEARHCNAGTNSKLPASTGKLAKMMKLPVAVLKIHGSYLSAPVWDEKHQRMVPWEARLEKVLSAEQVAEMSVGEINEVLTEHFQYDEYAWQLQKRIRVTYPKRAEGLHKVLYRCRSCGAQYRITSKGDTLTCGECGESWRMDEYGRLVEEGSGAFIHIPDWYEEQRAAVHREVDNGRYSLRVGALVEALPSHRGFVPQGRAILEHTADGFRLKLCETGEILQFTSAAMESVHTEYDYQGKGQCVVLSTKDCCYYIYPDAESAARFNVTKIQFAGERLHEIARAGAQGQVGTKENAV